MLTYRARIRMTGGYISRLQSDTVFGGLCWAYKTLAGETELHKLLELCRAGTPPFVVSDLLPGDYLPRPYAAHRPGVAEQTTKSSRLETARQAKASKGTKWLTPDEFAAFAVGRPALVESKKATETTVLTLHNTVNRHTGTTGDNSLYELPETFSTADHFSLYIRVVKGWEDTVYKLVEQLGHMGIGKRRSVGKGGFTILDYQPFAGFDEVPQANAFVSLSHFVPHETDPAQGCYKTVVKYGKLDREYALSGNPFKYPLILLMPGSTFFTGSKPRPYYGKAVTGLAPVLPEAIQGCFAFAAPVYLNPE